MHDCSFFWNRMYVKLIQAQKPFYVQPVAYVLEKINQTMSIVFLVLCMILFKLSNMIYLLFFECIMTSVDTNISLNSKKT